MKAPQCILLLALTGCEPVLWAESAAPVPSRTWYAQTLDEQAFDQSVNAGIIDVRETAGEVEVFESEADRPTEIIGTIAVREPMTSFTDALRELRESAARVGADAIVHVELHRDDRASEQTVTLSGVAVRYGDLLAGRGYVVLGDIQIDGATDDDLVTAMRERARAMGADAVVGVHMQRGNAGGMLRAQGTAIRFGNQRTASRLGD
jgi:uncharacterized protein YbjQ (UPF0145 family)